MTARIATRTGVQLPSPPAPKAFGAVTPEQRQGGLCVAQFVPELSHSRQSCESTRRIRIGGTDWRSLLHKRSREDRCRSKKEGKYKMPTARPMNVEIHDVTPKWRRTLSSKQGIFSNGISQLPLTDYKHERRFPGALFLAFVYRLSLLARSFFRQIL